MDRQKRLDLCGEVFFALCKKVNTPVSLGAWIRWKHREYKGLVELALNPKWYLDSERFSADYLVVSYLRKLEGLPTGIDQRDVALRSFIEAEERCRTVNMLFRDPYLRGLSPRLHRALSVMQAKIGAVLGNVDYVAVSKLSKWGPGATQTLRRAEALRANKIGELPISTTPACLKYVKREIEHDPHWAGVLLGVIPEGPFSLLRSCFKTVEGNRVVFVDKDAKTKRTIAAEPTGNSFIQQGIGRYIRRRLRAFGVDLDDQRVNQTWASLAQQLGLCTVDLRSASDSISRGLVCHLLPFQWFELLDDVRSPSYYLDGSWHYSHKFSSMGNAFTFELETLVFWAAVQAAYEIEGVPLGLASVYGDDIICEAKVYLALTEILTSLGFVVNQEKSFHEGLFFESCGKHFFNGDDVTPVYQKEWHCERGIASVISAYNRLYRFASRASAVFHRVAPSAADAASAVLIRQAENLWFGKSRATSYRVPEGSDGDDGFLTPFHEFDEYCENHGFYCQVLLPKLTPHLDETGGEYAWRIRTNSHRHVSCWHDILDVSSAEGGSRADEAGFRKSSRWIVPYSVV